MFDVFSGFCVDQFLKRAGRNRLNKLHAVLEKVGDNEELMECNGDPVIYFRSSKDFEIAVKRKISSALVIDIESAKTRYNTIRTSFMKQLRCTQNKQET